MAEPEYKEQVFSTTAQWRSGLLYKLRLQADGITLFARPAFSKWVDLNTAGRPYGIAVDECGLIYWTGAERDSETGAGAWNLYRHDPKTSLTERLIRLNGWSAADCRPEESATLAGTRIWLTRSHFFLLDPASNRLLGFFRPTFQIVYELPIEGDVIDADFDGDSIFYLLEKAEGKVRLCVVPTPDRARVMFDPPAERHCRKLDLTPEPIGIAFSPLGYLYVLSPRAEKPGRLLRLELKNGMPTSDPPQLVNDFASRSAMARKSAAIEIPIYFNPTAIDADSRGVIYVREQRRQDAGGAPARLHQFDGDGAYLGAVKLPDDAGDVTDIGFKQNGDLYLVTDRGVGAFSLSATLIGETGFYYSKTLDLGKAGDRWHRIALDGAIPARTTVEVSYYTADQDALRESIDGILEDQHRSSQEKRAEYENRLAPYWSEPEVFRGSLDTNAPDSHEPSDAAAEIHEALIVENRGRYLWLRIQLSTFDEKQQPLIHRATVSYPRQSYLRYLPSTYREDQVSADFLERFLSLFETHLYELDRKIDDLHVHFDPERAPTKFLSWLASWIGFAIEEGSTDGDGPDPLSLQRRAVAWARTREIIARAPALLRAKGTPAGIAQLVEVFTGHRAFVIEHALHTKPLVLGHALPLGMSTYVLGSRVRGFRLGDSSIVGRAMLRDQADIADEPFSSTAHRFTVLVDMPSAEYRRYERRLSALVDDFKPAHTECTLRLVSEIGTVGSTLVGIDSRVTDFEGFHVGVTPLGRSLAAADHLAERSVGRDARIGK